MRHLRVTGTVAVFLLFGTMMPVCPQPGVQSDKQDDKQREKQEAKRNKANKPKISPKNAVTPPPRRTQQQAREWQQQQGWLKQGGWQRQDTWQRHRAQRWDFEHRGWGQRGGYGGYYVPEDRFNLYFGNRHPFRLHTRPVIYLGYPRFEYSGFSFLVVDPWPEYWADNWYDADDVYIDYDDGYYLYNCSYPRVRLAITVVL